MYAAKRGATVTCNVLMRDFNVRRRLPRRLTNRDHSQWSSALEERSWQSLLWFPCSTSMERRRDSGAAVTSDRAARKARERTFPRVAALAKSHVSFALSPAARLVPPPALHSAAVAAFPTHFRQQSRCEPFARYCRHVDGPASEFSDVPAEACHVAYPPISSRLLAR